jgi:putative transcriptional regulator
MFARNTDMIGLTAALSGQLDPSLALLSETQACVLGVRAGNAGIVDSVGGVSLENEQPAPVRASFADDVMARIEAYEVSCFKAQQAALAAGNALSELLALPQPLRDLSLVAAGGTGWTFAGPGVKSMVIETGGKLPARLLRIEPGYGAPNHDHTGTEYTLVVKGAFYDGSGRFGPGELSIKRPGQIHHPVAEPGDICFALSVEEGEVAFTGALGVLQRLFTRH